MAMFTMQARAPSAAPRGLRHFKGGKASQAGLARATHIAPVEPSEGSSSAACQFEGPLNQSHLNHLLDLEEDAYFASRRPESPAVEQGLLVEEREVISVTEPVGARGDETTVMVKNIACRFCADDVLELVHQLGFEACYDFFYLPLWRSGKANAGYFFMNFKHASDVTRLQDVLQGQSLGLSAKRCEVVLAQWQGLEELRAQFENKAVMKAGKGKAPLFL